MTQQRKIEPLQILIEIAVITIGILIAYQLNSWKETRNNLEAERKMLSEIKSNLVLDKMDFLANKNAHQKAIKLIDSLRRWDGDYSAEISYMFFSIFRDYLFLPQTSAFETLKSKGIDLIRNDSIRIGIQRLHDFHYKIILDYESTYAANQFYDDLEHVSLTYFESFPINSSRYAVPKTIDTEWLHNNDISVRLDLCEFEHNFCIKLYETTEKEMDRLIEAIDQELE